LKKVLQTAVPNNGKMEGNKRNEEKCGRKINSEPYEKQR